MSDQYSLTLFKTRRENGEMDLLVKGRKMTFDFKNYSSEKVNEIKVWLLQVPFLLYVWGHVPTELLHERHLRCLSEWRARGRSFNLSPINAVVNFKTIETGKVQPQHIVKFSHLVEDVNDIISKLLEHRGRFELDIYEEGTYHLFVNVKTELLDLYFKLEEDPQNKNFL